MKKENTWTQGRDYYTLGSTGGIGEGQRGVGRVGRDNMGRNAGYRIHLKFKKRKYKII